MFDWLSLDPSNIHNMNIFHHGMMHASCWFQYLVGCLTRHGDCARYSSNLHIINTIISSILLTCMRVIYFNIETGDWLSEYDTIELLAHIGMVANILLIPPLTFLSKKDSTLTLLPNALEMWAQNDISTSKEASANPLRFLLLYYPTYFVLAPPPHIEMGSSHKCCLLLHNPFSWVSSSCFTSSFRHMFGHCPTFDGKE